MASDKVDLTEHRDFGGKFDDDEEYVNSIIIDEASELAADENMSVDDYMKLSLFENMFGKKIYHRYTSNIFNSHKCFENNEHQHDRVPWRSKLVGFGSRDATEIQIFDMK